MTYEEILQQEWFKVPVDEAEIHRLASINPMMEEVQYRALVEDIDEKGQLFPALVYRGKIVDGRHRLLALKELGAKHINAVKIPNNFTKKEVLDVLNSAETRRHEDKTAMAIRGYRLWQDEGFTRVEAARAAGCAPSLLSNLRKIEELGGSYIIDSLWEGAYHRTLDKKVTRSLPVIEADLKARAPKPEPGPEEDESNDPRYKDVIKKYREAPTGIQDAIYEAIRAMRMGE